ncbi:MAG: hypothetical protein V4678_01960 [Patescibacteria group bacterium]
MATFEGMGFCDEREYKTAFETRLQHADLTRDDLYVARFELNDSDRFFRILGRVGLVSTSPASVALGSVEVDFVNDMLKPALPHSLSGLMNDGIWRAWTPFYVNLNNGSSLGVRNALFSGYDGNVGTEFETFLALESDRNLVLS